MTLDGVIWTFALLLTSLHSHVFTVAAQTCYYPNGDIATDDAPCSDGDGICCPLNWMCMDNGLCYLKNEDYYERHTCTDRSWPSDICPRICTQNQQAGGNEAILWCNHEEWCCDGNRSWNCCTTRNTNFFDLPDPHSVAFISVTPSAQSHPPSRSASASSSPSAKETIPFITSDSTYSSTTTGTDESPSTIFKTVAPISSPTSTKGSVHDPGRDTENDTNFGLTVGLGVGIPFLLVLCGLLAFFIFRRRGKPKKDDSFPRAESPPMEANYQNIAAGSHAPEIEGYPIAAKRSKSGRRSELYGSDVDIRSPALSTGSNTTSPPQYSPGQYSPANKGGMAQIPEEEPAELWGGYVPYRPPRNGQEEESRPLSGGQDQTGS